MELLYVRWYRLDPAQRGRSARFWLDRVGFVPVADGGAFGFIHPSEVIRACHIVPVYAYGREEETVGHSFVQDLQGDYYIMR